MSELRKALLKEQLSYREAEVAEAVSKGVSNLEVACDLFVTEKTVKFHLTNIYKKMGIKSRAQLIVWSIPYRGLVEENVKPARKYQADVQPVKQATDLPSGAA